MSSFRMPQNLNTRLRAETGEDALRQEMMQEQAAALGRLGAKMEAALAALDAASGEARPAALREAADAVWCFLVQREVSGLRDRAAVVAHYRIPREVLNRLGAR